MPAGGAARRQHQLQQGRQRSGGSLMPLEGKIRRSFGLLIVALIGFAALPSSAQTPTAGTAEDWVGKLAGLETAPDLDIVALRQRATERIKAKAKGEAAPA